MAEVTGRPVDIEIVPRAHAILSASSAERWLVCTPSARIEETLEDQRSAYATDGTAAHAFAETRLRYLLKQITKPEYVAAYEATRKLYEEVVEEWTHADWDAIDDYVNYVLAERDRLGGSDVEVIIEARVDYSKFAQGGFGTSDTVLIARKAGIIKAIDLKFGKGVPVSATDNPQLKLYTLGALLAADESGEDIDTVEWTVHQPRLENVSSDSMSYDEIMDWARNVVAPAAKLAWEGEGNLVPTAKGCRFCKAGATCRARIAQNVLIARRDFMANMDKEGNFDASIHLMDPDEVARILPDIDSWLQWGNALKDHALKLARDKNISIPGYKLVRGRSNRSWNPSKDVESELKAIGVSETVMFEPGKLKTPTQMEKALGKSEFAKVAPVLVVKPDGAPALVPDSDPRESINAAAEARAEFDTPKA